MAKTQKKGETFRTGLGQMMFVNLVNPVPKDRKEAKDPDCKKVLSTQFFFEEGGKTSKALHKALDKYVKESFPNGVDEDFNLPIKNGTKAADKADRKAIQKDEEPGRQDYLRGMEFIQPKTNYNPKYPLQLFDGQQHISKRGEEDGLSKEDVIQEKIKLFRKGTNGYLMITPDTYDVDGNEGVTLYLAGAQFHSHGTVEGGGGGGGQQDLSALTAEHDGSREDVEDEDLDDL